VRVVFLSPVGELGGAERVLLLAIESLRALAGDELDLHVVLGAEGPLGDEVKKRDGEVHLLPLPTRLRVVGDSQLRTQEGGLIGRVNALGKLVAASSQLIGYVGKLRSLLQVLKPDLVHSNGFKMHILGALARPRSSKFLWHLHDFCSSRPVMRRALRWIAPRADGAIAISEAVKRDAQQVLRNSRITVIHNAVDLEHFQPHGAKADLDALAGLEPASAGTVRVGLVATYARWKGQEVFLQAASHCLNPRVRCYIIGGPIYQTGGSQFSREELVSLASRLGVLGSVGFIDFQPDTAPIYRALDVVVHASTQPEPFGLTIAEAMACGRAVVVARAGGAQELFHDELDALGVPPNDSQALATRIQQLAERPELRQRLGEAARTTAERRFASQAFAARLLSFYSSLLRYNCAIQARADSLVKIAQSTLTSSAHPVK